MGYMIFDSVRISLRMSEYIATLVVSKHLIINTFIIMLNRNSKEGIRPKCSYILK